MTRIFGGCPCKQIGGPASDCLFREILCARRGGDIWSELPSTFGVPPPISRLVIETTTPSCGKGGRSAARSEPDMTGVGEADTADQCQ